MDSERDTEGRYCSRKTPRTPKEHNLSSSFLWRHRDFINNRLITSWKYHNIHDNHKKLGPLSQRFHVKLTMWEFGKGDEENLVWELLRFYPKKTNTRQFLESEDAAGTEARFSEHTNGTTIPTEHYCSRSPPLAALSTAPSAAAAQKTADRCQTFRQCLPRTGALYIPNGYENRKSK